EATALRLAHEGFQVILGARRLERLEDLAERCGGRALALDVTDAESVSNFCAQIPGCHILVNNAGLALGLEPVSELSEDRVRTMWETNVMGLLRVTQGLLGKLEASGAGHIVNMGSIAGREAYPGGGGYTTSKHAVRVLTRTMRFELVGKPIRITEIAPGFVETEFSLVRFDGDVEKAKKPYEGLQPLTAEDVADCVAWAVTRPPHVNIDEIVVQPLAQASATVIARD
ncbi:MAG: SDR family NAD(P)-dependent oxidoreductase, partial [Actinomycetota bacterium]